MNLVKPPQHYTQFVILCSICLGLLGGLALMSSPFIKANQEAAALEQLRQVLPPDTPVTLAQLERLTETGYAQVDACQFLYLTKTKGYNSELRVLSGFTMIQNQLFLNGVRVLPPHGETPGLGDVIDSAKSPWIYQFDKVLLAFTQPIESDPTVFDPSVFDMVTGATLSTSAVINAVQKAILQAPQHTQQKGIINDC